MPSAVSFGGGLTKYAKRVKYKLTQESKVLPDGTVVYRIKALHSFKNANQGALGGWVEKETNLSHTGDCWVYDNVIVYGSASVSGNAVVTGNVIVSGKAEIRGDSTVSDNVIVSGHAVITGNAIVVDSVNVSGSARIDGNAFIQGDSGSTISGGTVTDGAEVRGKFNISGTPKIFESSQVHGVDYPINISGCVQIYGFSYVLDFMSAQFIIPSIDAKYTSTNITGSAEIYGKCTISGRVNISGNVKVFGNAEVSGYAVLRDFCRVLDNAKISDGPQIGGTSAIGENSIISGFPRIFGNSRILGSAKVQGHAHIFGYGKAKDGVIITGNTTVAGYAVIEGAVMINGTYPISNDGTFTTLSYKDLHDSLDKTVQRLGVFTQPLKNYSRTDLTYAGYGSLISGNTRIWSDNPAYYLDINVSEAYLTMRPVNSGKAIQYEDIADNVTFELHGDIGLQYNNIVSATLNVFNFSSPISVDLSSNTWHGSLTASQLTNNFDLHNVSFKPSEIVGKTFLQIESLKDNRANRFKASCSVNIEYKNPEGVSFYIRQKIDYQAIIRLPTPRPPVITLEQDTGRSNSDYITKDNKLVISVCPTCTSEYTFDKGVTWIPSPTNTLVLGDGKYLKSAIQFRTVDRFGYKSNIAYITNDFVIDTHIQSPTIRLINDAGLISNDNITFDGRLTFVAYEDNLDTLYSYNAGQTWAPFSIGSEIPEGVYPPGTIQLSATDIAGNNVISKNDVTFTVDKTYMPTLILGDSKDGNGIINTYYQDNSDTIIQVEKLIISGNINQNSIIRSLYAYDVKQQRVAVDTNLITINPDGSFTYTMNVEILVDGQIYVIMTSEDLAGNIRTVSSAIKKDTYTYLDFSILAGEDTGISNTDWITNKNVFHFRCNAELGNKIILYVDNVKIGTYSVDNTGFVQIISPILSDGKHTIKFSTWDTSNNELRKFIFPTIDTVIYPGVLSLIGFTDNGFSSTDFNTNDNTFTLLHTPAETYSSVKYYSAIEQNGIVGPYTETTTDQVNIPNGIYHFKVQTTDVAGNIGFTNEIRVGILKLDNPLAGDVLAYTLIQAYDIYGNPYWTNGSQISSGACLGPNYSFYLDSPHDTNLSTPTWYYSTMNDSLGDPIWVQCDNIVQNLNGKVLIKYTKIDLYGNLYHSNNFIAYAYSSVQSGTLSINSGAISNYAYYPYGTYNLSVSGQSTYATVNYYYGIIKTFNNSESITWVPCTNVITLSTDCKVAVKAIASTPCGYSASTQIIRFGIGTRNFNISLGSDYYQVPTISQKNETNKVPFSINLNGTLEDIDTVTVFANNQNITSVIQTGKYNIQLTDGIYDLTAQVTDGYGNIFSTNKINVTIDTTVNAGTLVLSKTSYNNFSLSITGSDSDLTNISYYARLPGASTYSQTTQTVFNNMPDGNYSFYALATDIATNTGKTNTVNYTVDSLVGDPYTFKSSNVTNIHYGYVDVSSPRINGFSNTSNAVSIYVDSTLSGSTQVNQDLINVSPTTTLTVFRWSYDLPVVATTETVKAATTVNGLTSENRKLIISANSSLSAFNSGIWVSGNSLTAQKFNSSGFTLALFDPYMNLVSQTNVNTTSDLMNYISKDTSGKYKFYMMALIVENSSSNSTIFDPNTGIDCLTVLEEFGLSYSKLATLFTAMGAGSSYIALLEYDPAINSIPVTINETLKRDSSRNYIVRDSSSYTIDPLSTKFNYSVKSSVLSKCIYSIDNPNTADSVSNLVMTLLYPFVSSSITNGLAKTGYINPNGVTTVKTSGTLNFITSNVFHSNEFSSLITFALPNNIQFHSNTYYPLIASSTEWSIGVNYNSGNITLAYKFSKYSDGTPGTIIDTGHSINLDTSYQVIFTNDPLNNKIDIYIDGTNVYYTNGPTMGSIANIFYQDQFSLFTSNNVDPGFYTSINAILVELAYFTGVLTPTEITYIYNNYVQNSSIKSVR